MEVGGLWKPNMLWKDEAPLGQTWDPPSGVYFSPPSPASPSPCNIGVTDDCNWDWDLEAKGESEKNAISIIEIVQYCHILENMNLRTSQRSTFIHPLIKSNIKTQIYIKVYFIHLFWQHTVLRVIRQLSTPRTALRYISLISKHQNRNKVKQLTTDGKNKVTK